MNQEDMITSIAEKTGFSKTDSKKFLDAHDDTVLEGLAKDGRVRLGKLGFLSTAYRAERTGPNPLKPGEKLNIPETVKAAFKASEFLKKAVATPENIAATKAKAK